MNTFAYALGNPITNIDRFGLDVLVCYYPEGITHVGFGDGNAGSSGSTSGFYPARSRPFDKGAVKSDDGHNEKECTSLNANSDQDTCMKKCSDKRFTNPGKYNVATRQCERGLI